MAYKPVSEGGITSAMHGRGIEEPQKHHHGPNLKLDWDLIDAVALNVLVLTWTTFYPSEKDVTSAQLAYNRISSCINGVRSHSLSHLDEVESIFTGLISGVMVSELVDIVLEMSSNFYARVPYDVAEIASAYTESVTSILPDGKVLAKMADLQNVSVRDLMSSALYSDTAKYGELYDLLMVHPWVLMLLVLRRAGAFSGRGFAELFPSPSARTQRA